MANTTKNYLLSYLERGDIWYPDVDQKNMQTIENILLACDYFAESGIVQMNSCAILNNASSTLKQAFYEAAFDYLNPLFFNVSRCECQHIANQDTVADFIADSNMAVADILKSTIDGAYMRPGYTVFLTAQTSVAENGIYDITIAGAIKRSVQPKKVFVKSQSANYAYTIWVFNAQTYDCLNLYTCILCVDGLIAIENSKGLTPSTACYVKPNSTGSKTLLAYAPAKFYATGVPILLVANNMPFEDVSLATFSCTSTNFTGYYAISSLVLTSSNRYLVDFSSTTYESKDSYKNLHNHTNDKNKLQLANCRRLKLIPTSAVSGGCYAYTDDNTVFQFDTASNVISALFVNGTSINTQEIAYNSTLAKFDLSFPVSINDDIYILVSNYNYLSLVTLPSATAGSASLVLRGSTSNKPYTWNISNYDNYQLIINAKSLSQNTYSLDNTNGAITINASNFSNLPISAGVLDGAQIQISSSKNDASSFFDTTDRISRLDPPKIYGENLSYRSKHNKFDLQNSVNGYKYIALHSVANDTFRVPFINRAFSGFDVNFTSNVRAALSNGKNTIIHVDNSVYAIKNNKLVPLFENFSDVYTQVEKIYKILNAEEKYIVLLSDGGLNYLLGLADFGTSAFTHHEFVYDEAITDVAAVESGGILSVYIASGTGVALANFNQLVPAFEKVYFYLSYSGSELYSYLGANILQIALSVANNEHEIYAVVNDFPAAGNQTVAALKSQKIVLSDTTCKVFEIGETGGLSNCGIIALNTTDCYVSAEPADETAFPFAYGENLTISSTNVTCQTSSLYALPVSGGTITGANLGLLDDAAVNINDYILVRHQGNVSENGIYLITNVAGSTFDAQQQTLDNLSNGNYVPVVAGRHAANSVWDAQDVNGASAYFKLRYTNLDAALQTATHVYISGKNNIALSLPSSVVNIYDSSYVTSDIYAHTSNTVAVTNQIMAAYYDTNTIITSKTILSENFYNAALSGEVVFSYEYPISQGKIISLYNAPPFSWTINQIVHFTNGAKSGSATITEITGSTVHLEVIEVNAYSIGKAVVHSGNFTYTEYISHSIFDTEWWSGLRASNSNLYLSPLAAADYTFSLENREITLNTASFSGSVFYGALTNIDANILTDSDKHYDAANNSDVVTYDNKIIGEFNQTDSNYIIEHSSAKPTLDSNGVLLVNSSDKEAYENNQNYTGVVASQMGEDFGRFMSGSISNAEIIAAQDMLYMQKNVKSNSIDNKIFRQNTLSSQAVTNNLNIDDSLATAIPGYERFSSSGNIQTISLDVSDASTYQDNASDFESGLANYNLTSGNTAAYNAATKFVTVNDSLFAISYGRIMPVNASEYNTLSPVATLNFAFCYDAYVNSDYIYIATENGLFVLDYNFNLVSHSCAGSTVKTIYFDESSNLLYYGIQNILACLNIGDFTNDNVIIPCDFINCIQKITINNPSVNKDYILVGTNAGLFAFTNSIATSNQELPIIGAKYLYGKPITLAETAVKHKLGANKNSLAQNYDTLTTLFEEEKQVDSNGQPYISDILVSGTSAYLFTDDGIINYTSLFNINLESSEFNVQSFEPSTHLLAGLAAYKCDELNDDTNNIHVFCLHTTDGLYYSFDNLYNFIKANINYKTFDACCLSGVWYVAANNGVYTSSNLGLNYTKYNAARGLMLSASQALDFTLSSLIDISVDQINIPIYIDVAGAYSFTLDVYDTNYTSGAQTGPALTTQTINDTYKIGQYILKFKSLSLSLASKINYTLELTSSSSEYAVVNIANSSNEYFDIHLVNISDKTLKPSVKLCTSASASETTLDQSLSISDFNIASSIKTSNSALMAPFKIGEVQYVIDNSQSCVSLLNSTSNINAFINAVNTALAARFDLLNANIIYADKYTTGMNAASQAATGPTALSVSGSVQRTRIIDAINIAQSRLNPASYASGSIDTSDYTTYFGLLTNAEKAYIFRRMLSANSYAAWANIDYNYDVALATGTAYSLLQNGYPLGLTLGVNIKVYVFVGDTFIDASDYTISNNEINFSSVPSGAVLSDVRIYFLDGYPAISTLSDLTSAGNIAYFNKWWSSFVSNDESRIIVVLSDYLDNYSVSQLEDYIGIINDNENILLVLCGLTSVPTTLINNLGTNAISIPYNASETFADYASRVSGVLSGLIHPALYSKAAIALHKNVSKINATFTNLKVHAILRDIYSNSILDIKELTSTVDYVLPDIKENKTAEFILFGSGSISDITLTYSYPTDFLLTQAYSGSQTVAYDGNIYISKVNAGILNSRINAVAANNAYGIRDYSTGWSYSSHGTPGWIAGAARMLATGPYLKAQAIAIDSNESNYTKYAVNNTLFSRLPISSIFSSTTGPQEFPAPNLDFNPFDTTMDELAGVVDTIVDILGTMRSNASGSEALNVWWDWKNIIGRGKYYYNGGGYCNTDNMLVVFSGLNDNNDLKMAFQVNTIAGIDDKYADEYSLQSQLVLPSSLSAYANIGHEVQKGNTQFIKTIPTAEQHYGITYNPSNYFYLTGNSDKSAGTFEAQIFDINDYSNNKLIKNSVPSATPLSITVSKFKTNTFSIVGFAPVFVGAGRKLRYIDNDEWLLSGPAYTGSSALYNIPISKITSLGANSKNTVSEIGAYNVDSFALDENYSPTIDTLYTYVNSTASTTCGLNDAISLSAIVNRNDNSSGSVYAYKFNIGDQIVLSVSWYGVATVNNTPILIASSNELVIAQETYNLFKGGYVYAEVKAQRGLALGDVRTTGQIFVI
jgi:hypothetical protein